MRERGARGGGEIEKVERLNGIGCLVSEDVRGLLDLSCCRRYSAVARKHGEKRQMNGFLG